jgi:hypothetical protein
MTCWYCGLEIDSTSLSPWFCGRICSQDYWLSVPHDPLTEQENRESSVTVRAATKSTRSFELPLMGKGGY